MSWRATYSVLEIVHWDGETIVFRPQVRRLHGWEPIGWVDDAPKSFATSAEAWTACRTHHDNELNEMLDAEDAQKPYYGKGDR
jgi:hypothetical protein